MKKLFAIAGFILAFSLSWSQHQAMYSQYMFNSLVINPAYAGSRDVLSLTALHRNQWTGFEGAPQTSTFAAHTPLHNPKHNIGIVALHDRLGVSSNTSFSGIYAYRIDWEKARLSFGLQGGVSMLQDRWSEIVTTDANDPSFTANSPTFWVPRVGFGAYFDTRTFYAGFSAPHLIDYQNPAYSQYVTNSVNYRPLLFTTGVIYSVNPYIQLKPSILVKYIQSSPVQFDLNFAAFWKERLWTGVSYRTRDAVVAILEWQINDQLRIGYSYDYSLSNLRRYNHGSHEIMLRYEFGYKLKAMSPRYF